MSTLSCKFLKIYINWRLITLQYCGGFCHTLTWISHGCTCVPHPEPLSPSHSSGLSQCTGFERPVSEYQSVYNLKTHADLLYSSHRTGYISNTLNLCWFKLFNVFFSGNTVIISPSLDCYFICESKIIFTWWGLQT